MRYTGQCTSLRLWKIVLRWAGACVSAFFVVQGAYLFTDTDFDEFWGFCRYVGVAGLHILFGCTTLYMEIKGSCSSVTSHWASDASNRLGLAVFYLWLGFYVMGGAETSGWAEYVSHIAGVVAWIVAAGDFVVATCANLKRKEEEEVGLSSNAESPKSLSATMGRSGAGGTASTRAAHDVEQPYGAYGQEADPYELGRSAAAAQPGSEPPPSVDDNSNEMPSGGWNTAGLGSFGAAR